MELEHVLSHVVVLVLKVAWELLRVSHPVF